jgi:hypothetical protein
MREFLLELVKRVGALLLVAGVLSSFIWLS